MEAKNQEVIVRAATLQLFAMWHYDGGEAVENSRAVRMAVPSSGPTGVDLGCLNKQPTRPAVAPFEGGSFVTPSEHQPR